MYINLQDDDQITLTLKEIAILATLATGPDNGYTIAKTCAQITRTHTPMSNGTLRAALKRLETTHLIRRILPTVPILRPGKPQIIYQLTPLGRLVLEEHVRDLQNLISLAGLPTV